MLVALCAAGLALPVCFHLLLSLLNVRVQMLQFVTVLINIAKLTAVKLSVELFIIFVLMPCRSYHGYLCLTYESLHCVVLTVVQLAPLSVVAALRYVVMFRDAVYFYAVPEAYCDTLYRFKGRKGRSEPSASEIELVIDKLKSHKSPGIDQIPAELIKAGGRTICLEIHKLITSIWKKEKLPEEWKESIIVPINKRGIKQIVIIIEAYHFCHPRTKFYTTSCSRG